MQNNPKFSCINQQDATFLNLYTPVRHCTCFRRVFRPSSGAQNCTYSVRYLSDRYCYLLLAWTASSKPGKHLTLYVQFWAPDDGRKTRLKHVQCLSGVYKLRKVASCWLYSENILAMHGHMNVKFLLYAAVRRVMVRCCWRATLKLRPLSRRPVYEYNSA